MVLMICGIDEAGRGPCVGPLVVAGVFVENDSELVRIGVCDSKQLTPKKREHIAPLIQKIVTKYEIIILPAADIDDLRRTMTLNELEVLSKNYIQIYAMLMQLTSKRNVSGKISCHIFPINHR